MKLLDKRRVRVVFEVARAHHVCKVVGVRDLKGSSIVTPVNIGLTRRVFQHHIEIADEWNNKVQTRSSKGGRVF